MGLDTSNNAYHGSYGYFNDFRTWLASKININLDDCIGFGGSKIELQTIDHKIIPLLDHSDCDGELTPEECKTIALGIQEILDSFVPEEKEKDFIEVVKQFQQGCLDAVDNNEIIYFG
ncbi:MAG: hypothetical protein WC222_11535 [Parachlamydiales bacterium]|jgi:hypothetical protein